jgi:hypothetical protein
MKMKSDKVSKLIGDMPKDIYKVEIPVKEPPAQPKVKPLIDYAYQSRPFVLQPKVTINHYSDTPGYFAIVLVMGGAVFAGMALMAVIAGLIK